MTPPLPVWCWEPARLHCWCACMGLWMAVWHATWLTGGVPAGSAAAGAPAPTGWWAAAGPCRWLPTGIASLAPAGCLGPCNPSGGRVLSTCNLQLEHVLLREDAAAHMMPCAAQVTAQLTQLLRCRPSREAATQPSTVRCAGPPLQLAALLLLQALSAHLQHAQTCPARSESDLPCACRSRTTWTTSLARSPSRSLLLLPARCRYSCLTGAAGAQTSTRPAALPLASVTHAPCCCWSGTFCRPAPSCCSIRTQSWRRLAARGWPTWRCAQRAGVTRAAPRGGLHLGHPEQHGADASGLKPPMDPARWPHRTRLQVHVCQQAARLLQDRGLPADAVPACSQTQRRASRRPGRSWQRRCAGAAWAPAACLHAALQHLSATRSCWSCGPLRP